MKRFFERLFPKPSLDSFLESRLSKHVALITAEKLSGIQSRFILLDTRSKKEYEVSHIDKAIWVDELPDKEILKNVLAETKTPVVVYCSVGIRSNAVAEVLNDLNYKNVYNLYGGIFEWKNHGFQVVTPAGKPTDAVHVFSKAWSRYLKSGNKVF